jgi:predicted nucleic-acid-binding protein
MGNECHVSLLALAEAGFVLASVYGASDEELVAQVQALLALATLHFEHEDRLPAALAGVLAGVDWFDAMLWAGSTSNPLATFDRDFARRAAKLGWTPTVESRLPASKRSQR